MYKIVKLNIPYVTNNYEHDVFVITHSNNTVYNNPYKKNDIIFTKKENNMSNEDIKNELLNLDTIVRYNNNINVFLYLPSFRLISLSKETTSYTSLIHLYRKEKIKNAINII